MKTEETDGYCAVQVGYGRAKVNKPEAGHLAKAGVDSLRTLQEFRVRPAPGRARRRAGHWPGPLVVHHRHANGSV